MQETSDLYKQILGSTHWKETRLLIGPKDASINLMTAYYDDVLRSINTSIRLFSEDTPSVGDCISGEINVSMNMPKSQPPRQGKLVPQIRLTDGQRHSEWISKGVFYIDTRKKSGEKSGIEVLTLTGFDAMLRSEQEYPSSALAWPASDIDVVREIAAFMDVDVDPRTVEMMTKGYKVQYPGGEYSCRETLGYIAAMYGGCFIMNDIGQLRLVKLNSIPKGTNYLIDNNGFAITFGGVRILV